MQLGNTASSKKKQKDELDQLYNFFKELEIQKHKNRHRLKQFYNEIIQMIEKTNS